MTFFGRLASALLLTMFLTNADVSDACECYVGQEPRPGFDRPFGWSVPFKDPCECTETRLGGLNVRPVVKPYDVVIGGNWRPVRANPQDELSHVTSSTVSSCAIYETKTDDGRIPQEGMFDSYPVDLHFSVRSLGSQVEINFKDFEGNDLYALSLDTSKSEVQIGSSVAHAHFDFNDAHRFWVTCLAGEIRFGKVGTLPSVLVHKLDRDYDSKELGFLTLESDEETNWTFYGEGCP